MRDKKLGVTPKRKNSDPLCWGKKKIEEVRKKKVESLEGSYVLEKTTRERLWTSDPGKDGEGTKKT